MSAAAPSPPIASRRRLVAARVLTVLAVLLCVVSVLANYVKREALDEERFRETSQALVAHPEIRDQVATILVEQLYANVDVAAVLRERLPPDMRELAGPIAGAVRQLADAAARRMLERPRVQDAFVAISSAAQRQVVAVLDEDTAVLETTGGRVVLDVRPLVLELGDRFSLVPDLESRVPEGAAAVTILDSDELGAAQDVTRLLRFVADWLWILVLAAAAGAVWLARGRRRREVRALAIGVIAVGILLLLVQTLVGRYLVDELVTTESMRPAVAAVYSILTELLRGDGWTGILIGVVALLGLWLSGPGARATATRRGLAPWLRRPELAYGAVVTGYLLLLWWQPTPQLGFARTVIVLFALALLGLEVLRRQTGREFPDEEPRRLGEALRGAVGRTPRGRSPATASGELERLARLHAEGALDDDEFAAAKAGVLGVPAGAGAPGP